MSATSRREFLASAAALPLALRPPFPSLIAFASRAEDRAPDGLLLDVGRHCTLKESLTGFARGLESAPIPFRRVSPDSIESARFILVPAGLMHSTEFAKALWRATSRGSRVVYESGAAYADMRHFEIEQTLLRDHFSLVTSTPVDLWSSRASTAPPSYVNYLWPAKVMVRDFSRAISVRPAPWTCAPACGTNSHIAFLPLGAAVASIQPIGKGEFIFLGSPLGPHLISGDREAQGLFEALISRS